MSLPNAMYNAPGDSQLLGQDANTPMGTAVAWAGLERGVQNPLLQLSSKYLGGALPFGDRREHLQSTLGKRGTQGEHGRTGYFQLLGNGIIGHTLVRQ